MKKSAKWLLLLLIAIPAVWWAVQRSTEELIHIGDRPFYLIDRLAAGPLKDQLQACAHKPIRRQPFSISHRGAPLMFPEHTLDSYQAAVRQGAGVLECDVAFTADKQLVCRHAQDDLHTTTNILQTPLAAQCTQPFIPANDGQPIDVECRTSDISAEQFLSLKGKMDGANPQGRTVEAYMDGTANWRTDLYAAEGGQLMTHAQFIEAFKALDVSFTPELKTPVETMPFAGMTQAQFAQKLIGEYKAAGVAPERVFPQSFLLDDVLYWIEQEPEFGRQAIFLDGRDGNPNDANSYSPSMQELADKGVRYIAPPLATLVTVKEGKMVPSDYAKAAKVAGLKIIAWSLERSGPLVKGGGFYYRTVNDIIHSDGQVYELVDVLAQQVGVSGIFSDWPATVTYYANCVGGL